MKRIVLASNNKHKIREFQENMKDYDIETMEDVGFVQDIVENGDNFYENAFIKAKTVHDYLLSKGIELDVIGEDTGLCVDALDGEPGIYSARYAGDHDDEANRDLLLLKLKDRKDRSAHFTCQIVLVRADGSIEAVKGKTYGRILEEERGSKEFGYDCLFYSNDLGKTFGEATSSEKATVSQRGKAIQELLKVL